MMHLDVKSLTGGNVLLQLVSQEAVDQLLARLHVVLQLGPVLLQDSPVQRSLVLHDRQSLFYLRVPAWELLVGRPELLGAAGLHALQQRRKLLALRFV